jgi:hypothetical protein
VVDLGEASVGDGTPGRGQTPKFGDFGGRILAGKDELVAFGMVVEAAEGGDEVFGGAASAAGVAAGDDVVFDVFDEVFDLGGGGFVELAVAPVLFDAVPVAAVTRRVPSETAAATIGMYSAKVGIGCCGADVVRRSSGARPSRVSRSRAASRSSWLPWACRWVMRSPPGVRGGVVRAGRRVRWVGGR